jgi:hypothetical protein
MLDPAFTFARRNRNHQPAVPFQASSTCALCDVLVCDLELLPEHNDLLVHLSERHLVDWLRPTSWIDVVGIGLITKMMIDKVVGQGPACPDSSAWISTSTSRGGVF